MSVNFRQNGGVTGILYLEMETGCIQEWDFLIKKSEKCCLMEEKAGF